MGWRWPGIFSNHAAKESSKPMTEDSNVTWTGPSVRVRDVRSLLDSDEMKRDIEAIKRLRAAGFIKK